LEISGINGKVFLELFNYKLELLELGCCDSILSYYAGLFLPGCFNLSFCSNTDFLSCLPSFISIKVNLTSSLVDLLSFGSV